MAHSVLILGGRAPVALDHARRFARQGWRAVVADSIPCHTAGASRAVCATVRLAPPRTEPARFVEDLRQAVHQHRIDLVVPTCEEVFFLSRHRAKLPVTLTVAVDDFDKLRGLHSKWQFLALARECGFRVADSALVDSLDQARAWAGATPLVLKPEYSRFGAHLRLYPQGVPAAAPPLPAHGRWVAQHFVAGPEICSYSIAHQGRLLAHAAYRPTYRLSQSASFYFAHHESAAIQHCVETLVARIGFTGQIAFDWIEADPAHPTVLECNPRATSGLHLFGLDDAVPAALAGDAAVRDCITPSEQRPRMITAVMASAGLYDMARRGRLGEWRRAFASADDVITRPGDRAPLLGALRDLAAYGRLALSRRCSLRAATTRDIEWDGEELSP
ncbi:ATP-grasp domain-containing protein [Cupriavidus basilensis]|uniref:ATP-grasp domain-containing protein n=1 Tax=Cupriavidus basilensis TaxID=68895 RepID=UPI0039F67CBF